MSVFLSKTRPTTIHHQFRRKAAVGRADLCIERRLRRLVERFRTDSSQGYQRLATTRLPVRSTSTDIFFLYPTENSLAMLNHKILEANSQVQNVKLGGHQTCLSINRLWHELCDMLRRLVGTTAPGHHDCSIQE
ncbi:uncharacterized protein TNCV_665161 [Trichonephila clavipes]|uniref:Uncharacterized protein n=1 Tax=Trichonephila clavipes TaxID=2585209 RepID=A0A8X6VN82_TRICX|nr:uncharacterized protein TNCV_665161 [Trichonephila clavipes]